MYIYVCVGGHPTFNFLESILNFLKGFDCSYLDLCEKRYPITIVGLVKFGWKLADVCFFLYG